GHNLIYKGLSHVHHFQKKIACFQEKIGRLMNFASGSIRNNFAVYLINRFRKEPNTTINKRLSRYPILSQSQIPSEQYPKEKRFENLEGDWLRR
ncbi:MAG: hypothetical protein OXC63_02335, partial [Aestuariivita sp.]|nr:hypothetical protein [Aestuariivita sp.]